MDQALSELLECKAHVRIEAVPGAGKTTLIVRACAALSTMGTPSLVLAYNKQLADDISRRTDALCVTFHSLCSRCLALARDDAQLIDAVERAERGKLLPVDVPEVKRVFVDEAQDVREIYVRLLRVLGLHGCLLVVAGDRNQLLYDFDPDAPATLETLQTPWNPFGNAEAEWSSLHMRTTHRLTHAVTSLVNAVFRTSIVCTRTGPPIEVRAPRNMWTDLYDLLRDVLEGDDDVLLLVDYKNGNTALRRLLNTVSRAGSKRVHVHGIEDYYDKDQCCQSEPVARSTNEHTLTCGTYWSAKGLECRTCVVILPEQAARNPTYVALTRASHRLIVVLDARKPHANVCAALRAIQTSDTVKYFDAFTQKVVSAGCTMHSNGAEALRPRHWGPDTDECSGSSAVVNQYSKNMERWSPKSNTAASSLLSVVRRTPGAVHENGTHAELVVRMSLVAAEFQHKNRVRAMEDILHPTRLDRSKHTSAIRAGCASRIVSQFATDDELLAPDLRLACVEAYRRLSLRDHNTTTMRVDDVARVALGIESFDSWDHTMRVLLPAVHTLATSVTKAAIDFVAACIPPTSSFDVRLCGDDCHVRVHASTPERCFHVVWDAAGGGVVIAAGVRASLHPSHVCTVLEVSTRTCTDVSLDNAALFLNV